MKLDNKAKYKVDALRQKFREGVPDELAKAFSRRLKRHEWETLHKLAQADIMHLPIDDALALFKDPSQIDSMILDQEEQVRSLGQRNGNRYLTKAKALATYMVSRKVTSRMMQRNAHAIAHLYGEEKLDSVPDGLVESIEALTSLYAFRQLDDNTKELFKTLTETEAEGMQTVIGVLKSIRALEKSRRDQDGAVNSVARANGWQGYVPSNLVQGSSVILAELDEAAYYEARGYVKVADHIPDDHDDGVPRAYFQSSVGGRNAFRQGIAQSVHESWQGVDARTGMTKGEYTSGLIAGDEADDIAASITGSGNIDNLVADNHLLPIFDGDGNVKGFERSLDPEYLDDLPEVFRV